MKLVRRIASASDRTIDRLLRFGVVALVVGVLAFAGLYYRAQHVSAGPSLISRQVAAAEQIVRKAPGNLEARLMLAAAYRLAKRYDDALQQYSEVLKINHNHHGALLGRGLVLMDKGDLKEAKKSFEKILGTAAKGEFAGADPQMEQALYYLGSIAIKQNQPHEAIARLQGALRIERTDADALYLLGVAQLKTGAAAAAVASLRSALLFVPTGWCDPYDQLVDAYGKLGRTADGAYAQGMLDFCQKRPADGIRRLAALTSGPLAVDAMLGLAVIAEQMSNRADAVGWYQKVLARDARNISAISGLARLGVRPPALSKSSPPASSSSSGQGSH